MTIEFRVELGAIPAELAREARAAGSFSLLNGMRQAAADRMGAYLWRELARATPVGATALLSKAAYYEPGPGVGEGYVGYRGAPSLYASFVEDDTRPHWPPEAPIAYWVARVLGYPLGSPDNRSVTFLVRRKISRKGTTGKHMVERTANDHRTRAQQIGIRAAADYLNAWKRGA